MVEQARVSGIMRCGRQTHLSQMDDRACRPIILDPSRPHPARPRRPASAQRRAYLLAYLAILPDPRARAGRRHSLVAILTMAAAAVLTGARSMTTIAEWAADTPQPVRAALGPRRAALDQWVVPAEATTRRTLARGPGGARSWCRPHRRANSSVDHPPHPARTTSPVVTPSRLIDRGL
jgi:DDE_Tnp_1-associated